MSAFTDGETIEIRSVSQDEHTGKAVRVHWIDSGLSAHGWQKMEDMPSMVETCESVGIWMGENERIVMLGGSRDSGNNNWNEAQLIYKPCIVSTEWL